MSKESKYDVIVNSYGIASVMAASYLADRGVSVLLYDHNPTVLIGDDDFNAYPYEIPAISLSSDEYDSDLMSFIGLDGMGRLMISEVEPIGVVFRDTRLDFKYPYIMDDVKRAFGTDQAERLHHLLDELKLRSSRRPCSWKRADRFSLSRMYNTVRHELSFSGINKLYDRYGICTRLRGIINSLLFVMTGVHADDYKLTDASKTISCALNGVGISVPGVYSLRSSMLELVKGKVDVDRSTTVVDDLKDIPTIDDADPSKSRFVEEFKRFKGVLSDSIMYPLSLYAKMDEELLSSAMPGFVIYIDADVSDYFEPTDVYVLRTWADKESTCLRLTTFVPFGSFDIDDKQHRDRMLKMRAIMYKLIPNAMTFDVQYYPDIEGDDLALQLSNIFDNIGQEDLVYESSALGRSRYKEQRGVLKCGREQTPYLGFDGLAAKAITISEKILRKIKK